MCGIAGIVTERGDVELRCALEKMNRAMHHRGPDGNGIYSAPNGCAGLGNCRLAILDPSPAGHMPMSTEDGRLTITYNGELYNFRELSTELEARGHRFRSSTDTEVVLRMYLEYGDQSVERLNGMFAFAIWDDRDQSLFLARDRIGIKPMYYFRAGDTFLVASELRALLATGLIPLKGDRSAMAGYLSLGSVPDDRTIIRGICSFPPAHMAKLQAGHLIVRRYWSHADEMRDAETYPEWEIEEAVREALKSAVQRQLVSDVPLGLFLSGGMDSGTLAALMRAVGHDTIRSVSIAFEESDFDESVGVRAVAERFGTQHIERVVTASDVEDELDNIVAAMDQPTVDGVNTYFVSMAAKEAGLTVALSGLGADELFGGYRTFTTVPHAREALVTATSLPGYRNLAIIAARSPLIPYRARKLAGWLDSSASLEAAYLAVRGLVPPREAAALVPRDQFDAESYVARTVDRTEMTETDAVSLLESRIYMHNQLLRDTDAMSMTHSLEVRVPFLDNEIIRVAARCRGLLGRGHKPALARARSIYFPLGERAEAKRGFTFPLDHWLRGALKPSVRPLLQYPRYLDSNATNSVLNRFEDCRVHWSAIWAPVVLERWLAAYGIETSREDPCASWF